MSLPTLFCIPALAAIVFWLSPETLTSYEAYFYDDYREAYVYFADRPGTTIYASGVRPYFLLGRQAQHRIVYDLNPRERELLTNPSGFVDAIARCVGPEFFVFSDHRIGNGYFGLLARASHLVVVLRTEHVVVFHHARSSSGNADGCPPRPSMSG
jgi:hypothetical protein